MPSASANIKHFAPVMSGKNLVRAQKERSLVKKKGSAVVLMTPARTSGHRESLQLESHYPPGACRSSETSHVAWPTWCSGRTAVLNCLSQLGSWSHAEMLQAMTRITAKAFSRRNFAGWPRQTTPHRDRPVVGRSADKGQESTTRSKARNGRVPQPFGALPVVISASGPLQRWLCDANSPVPCSAPPGTFQLATLTVTRMQAGRRAQRETAQR